MCGGYLIFVMHVNFGYLKNIYSKNSWLWVFQKIEKTTKFHEITSKDLGVLGGYLIF
jgi:hypothetical protein